MEGWLFRSPWFVLSKRGDPMLGVACWTDLLLSSGAGLVLQHARQWDGARGEGWLHTHTALVRVGAGCGLGLGHREWVTQGRVTRGPRRLFREPLSCKAGQPRLRPALGQRWDSRYLELAAPRGTQVILAGLLHGPGSALLVDRSRRLHQRGLTSCSPRMETPLLCTG